MANASSASLRADDVKEGHVGEAHFDTVDAANATVQGAVRGLREVCVVDEVNVLANKL